MTGLRWILLAVGLVFIAFVYLYTRYQQSRHGASKRRRSLQPMEVPPAPFTGGREDVDEDVRLDLERMSALVGDNDDALPRDVLIDVLDEDIDMSDEPASRPVPETAPVQPQVSEDTEQLIVLSVMAPEDELFEGPALLAALERAGLEFGDLNIYHRMTLAGGRRLPVFSVASAIKPGSLVPHEMAHFTTPGLSLFLQLPGPLAGVEAFDDLVKTAERLAAELGGVLRDQDHQAVTHRMLMQVRQQIAGAGSTVQHSAL